ncbi:MAG TPA: outer membrane beta-barrel protein, partial [Candidatus Acidoferrales bacterium]|nr:outer membrane beta-barrel protein [Candidatus Acidoferrales bacterium]
MKIITHSMTVVGTALLGSVTGALAGDVSQNFYVNGDVGAIFQQDARFSQTAEPTLNASFNPGIRADIAIGYNLSQNFALELEPGFTWNSVDTLDGRQLFAGESIDLYSVPILVNAIFKFPTSTGWTPYLGAGIGPDIGFFDGSLPGSTYTDTDVSFAF